MPLVDFRNNKARKGRDHHLSHGRSLRATQMTREGIRLIHRLTKRTLNTYFPDWNFHPLEASKAVGFGILNKYCSFLTLNKKWCNNYTPKQVPYNLKDLSNTKSLKNHKTWQNYPEYVRFPKIIPFYTNFAWKTSLSIKSLKKIISF